MNNYCIMCGKEHTGDYYVCNACITEYNLTEEQIMEMGGKRDKFEINNSPKKSTDSTNTNKSPQVSPANSQKEITQKDNRGLNVLIGSMIALAVVISISYVAIFVSSSRQKTDKKTESEEYISETTTDIPSNQTSQSEPQLKSLSAEYTGSTEEGTDLNKYNTDITVYAEYENGDNYEVADYSIENPTKLKAGKTSTIKIIYENLECDLSVKCTSLTASQYKKKCQKIAYKKLARNPEKYEGKKLKYTGKIIQVMEDDDYTAFRIDVTKGKYGIWDDTVYVEFWGDSKKRFLEDDIVTFYGESEGLHTYETILGSSVTIPSIEAKYITLKK